MTNPTATRLHAADASVTVLSNTRFVTDWALRYFGSWWNAFEVPASGVCAGPLVTADIDDKTYAHCTHWSPPAPTTKSPTPRPACCSPGTAQAPSRASRPKRS